MAIVLTKVPPPPNLPSIDPMLNKWLIDLSSFINSGGGGGIDPDLIPGYNALVSTVNLHTSQISSLTVNVAANTSHIATNTASINTLFLNLTSVNNSIIALGTRTTALEARPIVRNGIIAPVIGLGSNGDWYADTVLLHIYVKVAGAWVLIV